MNECLNLQRSQFARRSSSSSTYKSQKQEKQESDIHYTSALAETLVNILHMPVLALARDSQRRMRGSARPAGAPGALAPHSLVCFNTRSLARTQKQSLAKQNKARAASAHMVPLTLTAGARIASALRHDVTRAQTSRARTPTHREELLLRPVRARLTAIATCRFFPSLRERAPLLTCEHSRERERARTLPLPLPSLSSAAAVPAA